jgi:hypothetical protein
MFMALVHDDDDDDDDATEIVALFELERIHQSTGDCEISVFNQIHRQIGDCVELGLSTKYSVKN